MLTVEKLQDSAVACQPQLSLKCKPVWMLWKIIWKDGLPYLDFQMIDEGWISLRLTDGCRAAAEPGKNVQLKITCLFFTLDLHTDL